MIQSKLDFMKKNEEIYDRMEKAEYYRQFLQNEIDALKKMAFKIILLGDEIRLT